MFNIIILGIASLLTDISSEMVYPLLPVYLTVTLGAGPALLGVVEGIAESLASLLKVFSGYFSDRTKRRKPFAIFGYASSSIGKLLLFIASSWTHVLASRVVDRFGKGIRTAPRDALIAESVEGGKKGAAFGLHRAMDTAGAAAGVVIAYFLLTQFKGDPRPIFLIAFIPALAGVACLFFVREKHAAETRVKERPQFRWAALDKRLKLFLVFTFLFTLGNSSNQFLLLRAKDLGNPLPRILLFYLLFNVTSAAVSYPAARLSDKIGRKALLVAGYLFYGVVYLGFAANSSADGFWLLFGLYGVYAGFTEGVEKALIADIAPAHLRATTIGLHATLVGVGLLPASLGAGLLWKFFGAAAPFYFGGLMGVTASLGLWFILRGL